MSKVRRRKFKVNSKEIGVVERLEYIFSFFKEDCAYREIEYEMKISDELKDNKIYIDDSRFSIVVYNLLSNSVKFTNGGQIKVSMKIID